MNDAGTTTDNDLRGKVALLAGGAGGLGHGVAAVFQAAGVRLVVADRSDPNLPGVAWKAADLLSERDVKRVVAETVAEFGRVDFLVNLIGGFAGGKGIAETTLDEYDRMMNLNLRTIFLTCREVFPHMIKRGGGCIVNVGARPAVAPVAGLSVYAASKAAVLNFTQTLAVEGKAHGVTVNAILPSIIDTPTNRAAMPEADPTAWVAPESIGRVLLFLCSDAARDVSGALLPVYGRS
jgi:NAD(P)-dependent dehydrogenase (short-subunit alcohol dehydrogenase family)